MKSTHKIRAYLQTAIISDKAMPIDGVLLYQAARMKHGKMVSASPNTVNIDLEALNMPLCKMNEGKSDWHYACTFAQWSEDVVEGKSFYTKRFRKNQTPYLDLGRKSKVQTNKGRYKAYQNTVYYRHALYIDWWAAVNDVALLKKMLDHITNLGKKASQGWGAVLRWEVVEDKSVVIDMTNRFVPNEIGGMLYGIRPPYWLPENQFRGLSMQG